MFDFEDTERPTGSPSVTPTVTPTATPSSSDPTMAPSVIPTTSPSTSQPTTPYVMPEVVSFTFYNLHPGVANKSLTTDVTVVSASDENLVEFSTGEEMYLSKGEKFSLNAFPSNGWVKTIKPASVTGSVPAWQTEYEFPSTQSA